MPNEFPLICHYYFSWILFTFLFNIGTDTTRNKQKKTHKKTHKQMRSVMHSISKLQKKTRQSETKQTNEKQRNNKKEKNLQIHIQNTSKGKVRLK